MKYFFVLSLLINLHFLFSMTVKPAVLTHKTEYKITSTKNVSTNYCPPFNKAMATKLMVIALLCIYFGVASYWLVFIANALNFISSPGVFILIPYSLFFIAIGLILTAVVYVIIGNIQKNND